MPRNVPRLCHRPRRQAATAHSTGGCRTGRSLEGRIPLRPPPPNPHALCATPASASRRASRPAPQALKARHQLSIASAPVQSASSLRHGWPLRVLPQLPRRAGNRTKHSPPLEHAACVRSCPRSSAAIWHGCWTSKIKHSCRWRGCIQMPAATPSRPAPPALSSMELACPAPPLRLLLQHRTKRLTAYWRHLGAMFCRWRQAGTVALGTSSTRAVQGAQPSNAVPWILAQRAQALPAKTPSTQDICSRH